MRALVSVYDKTGLADLARSLVELGWSLVASGGTAEALRTAGIPCTTVEQVTGAPELLGGRVKTLHPSVHAAILADRAKPEHMADLETHGIEPFDLVVCNLYQFATLPSIEMIDIGGPAMVRAAAKNHASVAVVVDPREYGGILEELRESGSLSAETRRRLAKAAFAHTAAYDAAIVGWLAEPEGRPAGPLPAALTIQLERAQELRYGENPHVQAARYREVGKANWWDKVVQHGGTELSYLNLYDAEAAFRMAHDLGDRPTCVIVKHANPCGAAVADDLPTAYRRALEGDERSAFGGVVAFNGEIDEAVAEAMAGGPQADVVIAPSYGAGAVDRLAAKRKATRLLEAPAIDRLRVHYRQIAGGFLVQEPPRFRARRGNWKVVTKVEPTEEQWADAELAWRVCGHTTSNAIVLVAGGQAVGIGAGQQSRVDAAELAARKAAGRATGGACASDAFFPFRDGIDAAAAAGVAVVIQPGGSRGDDDVIAAADEHGLAMILTGERQFRH